MLPTVEENRGFDFLDPDFLEKWRGVFVASLRKMLATLHPTLTAEEDALQYVESLCLRLLTILCAEPALLTPQDVEERVASTFPRPLDRWALSEVKEAVMLKKKRPVFPQDKVHQMLKEVLVYKVDVSVSVMITGILEYVCTDVLKLAGNFTKRMFRERCEPITCEDMEIAMCADKVLMDMFYAEWDVRPAPAEPAPPRRASLSYPELVRDLVSDERAFLRDLHLIIRVFKGELQKVTDDAKAITLIFGNIVDIYELTVTLLGNLEDALEVAQDSRQPCIGSCFEELAEVEEFRVYVRYGSIVGSREARDALQALLDDPLVWERLSTAGQGFNLAVKYLLPRLLLAPVRHVLLHHAYVLALLHLAPADEDRESLKQVECNLLPIKKSLLKALGNGPKIDGTLRAAASARRQLAVEKCAELEVLIENWDARDVTHCCNEFIREDTLTKITPGKKNAERRAFLFDGLLLLCKPITSLHALSKHVFQPSLKQRSPTDVESDTNSIRSESCETGSIGGGGGGGGGGAPAGGGGTPMKLKEKFHVRKMDLIDRPDTDDAKYLFELCPRAGQPVLLAAASLAEKQQWMCDLLTVNTKPMLDRTLDSILLDLEKKHPLKLPPPELYRFAVPDSPENIVLEERNVNLIKGATLLKLVERLTYHVYADLSLVRTFLTTYRSFCSPAELLALLVERFRIPEPGTVYDAPAPRIKTPKKEYSPSDTLEDVIAETVEQAALPTSDADKLSKNTTREDWKRYKNEFQQPVKFRVINVIRHWVDQHFYDFEREPALLQVLRDFLETVTDKQMRKWVVSVLKTVNRKSQVTPELDQQLVAHVFDRAPPPPLPHPADPARHRWHPLALHPAELARQLTQLEFTLYRQVRPSELVGAVWTKKNKETTSPNLLKIIKHTTNFTRWMEKWIVESENLEERVAVAARFLEVAVFLHELNNFNGVLAVVAAFESAAVHRLKNTYQLIPPRLTRNLDKLRSLNSRHFKRYSERLRSINPPCVPFLGVHLTNILHIEEGNLDFLPNTELINFSKRRKVAEITGEIQQYQNQPYCLTVEPKLRAFLESLEPFPGMDDQQITNHLYERSLHIEPRHSTPKQVPKFPRRYPELSLKQVKTTQRGARLSTSSDDSQTKPSSQGKNPAGQNNAINQASKNNPTHQSSQSIQSAVSQSCGGQGSQGAPQLSPTSCLWETRSLALNNDFETRSMTSTLSHSSLHSPRPALSLLDKGLALLDKASRGGRSNSYREEPPSPRDRHSPRHDRTSSSERKTPALSPRGAAPPPTSPAPAPAHSPAPGDCGASPEPQEEVPPLLPRSSAGPSEAPPSPPDRPLPSPKHYDLCRLPPALSPKRPPAPPAPPAAPAAPAHSPAAPQESRAMAFNFPSRGAPAPPLTPPPAPPCPAACPPPPLPPRRRRDSAPAGDKPAPVASPLPPTPPAPAGPGGDAAPPLPPRPPQPPPLLRPAHSAILQRRHLSTSNKAPKLPPKPPPPAPAAAPRTY